MSNMFTWIFMLIFVISALPLYFAWQSIKEKKQPTLSKKSLKLSGVISAISLVLMLVTIFISPSKSNQTSKRATNKDHLHIRGELVKWFYAVFLNTKSLKIRILILIDRISFSRWGSFWGVRVYKTKKAYILILTTKKYISSILVTSSSH